MPVVAFQRFLPIDEQRKGIVGAHHHGGAPDDGIRRQQQARTEIGGARRRPVETARLREPDPGAIIEAVLALGPQRRA